MKTYYISYRDRGLIPDLSKKDGTIKAENLDNLRARLIRENVFHEFPNFKPKMPVVYHGIIRIEDDNTGRYLGSMIFNQKDGRAYWMKAGAWDFYYPLSAKTGRISGEGMDYMRKPRRL